MRKFSFYSILLIITVTFLFHSVDDLSAQKPSILWDKNYGGQWDEFVENMQVTEDGNIIVFGTNSSIHPDGWWKMWLFKLDQNGELLWEKIYGDSGDILWLRDGKETSDGGFILAGRYSSSRTGTNFEYVIKTDNMGNVEWETQKDDTSHPGSYYGVLETQDSNYVLVSSVFSDSNSLDILLTKLDRNGNELWSRSYGDSSFEFGYSIIEAQDGGIVIAGFRNPIGDDPSHLLLLKTDSDGNLLWQKYHWEESSGAVAYDVKETFDQGFIIAGSKHKVGEDWDDGWVLKTDSIGDSVWSQQITFALGPSAKILSVIQSPDSDYIATGTHAPVQFSNPELFLTKIDRDGNIKWLENLEGLEGIALDEMTDGNILIAGETWIDNDTRWQVTVQKTDAQGVNFFVDKNFIDFGYVAQNATASEVIKYYNVGSTDIIIDSIAGKSPMFETELSSSTIAVGDSALITVRFRPTELFIFTDIIKIYSSVGSVAITVNGITESGFLDLISDLVSFGNVMMDSTAFGRAYLSNSGDMDLFIYSTHLSDSPFSIDVPDNHLLPNDTTWIPVSFSPLDSSVFLDTLTITTSGGIGKVLLYGNASTTEITVSTKLIDFGSTDVGTELAEEIVIFNTGKQPINVKDFLLLSQNFSVDAQKQLLFPGDSLSIGVTFAPIDAGTFDELLRVLGEKESAEVTLKGASTPVGVKSENSLFPHDYSLSYNYPNPFNPVTTIEFSLPRSGKISLVIYNLRGEEVARLINGTKPAGNHRISWNATNVSSGIYFYRLQSGDFVQTRKMVLLK
ncbi:MAG: DUF1573 domain-containing protein [Candidatus Marinimicrobia bacterium]|nr:DUF1573 domain-containing protein [Candidatus Neomarinimicrobiota bacterium]